MTLSTPPASGVAVVVFAAELRTVLAELAAMRAERDGLRAAGERLMPAIGMMAGHSTSPDEETINLVTTWSAVRQLASALIEPRPAESGT